MAKCKGKKKDGKRCGNKAGESGYCKVHDPNRIDEVVPPEVKEAAEAAEEPKEVIPFDGDSDEVIVPEAEPEEVAELKGEKDISGKFAVRVMSKSGGWKGRESKHLDEDLIQ